MNLEFSAQVAARGFDVSLSIAQGETVAVLGPNGAGKSTFLTVLAGLLRPDSGRAVLGDRVLFELGAGGRGRWLPPHERGVSMLAQDALLFPHLSALENVAFGPQSRGVSRAEARSRATAWLERVGVSELATRGPAQLSGGQAQRVAVARALASDPELLLLDEPLAALDVSAAPAVRRMLRDVLADRTALIVTHDILDAFTLADRVVVLEAGRVVDLGPTRDVLDRPRTPFAAGLAALNLLTGTVAAPGVVRADSPVAPGEAALLLRARFVDDLTAGDRAAVCIRPSAVTVSVTPTTDAAPTGPGDPERTVLPVTITDLEPRGDLVRVRAGDVAADAPPGRVADLDLAPGVRVWFGVTAADAVAYRL
ncbi:ABC transporter ATP-binding protein [Herbiconiux sp. CPCC 203407]|uniref:ABC transporter ATP-binding protein n=1 Tax=Herbiconiux oxytropis TaxID=2970915 RepID=A0AA41XI22_9MICO|nr:ABC transporter ATP-binding protein [Herbiconiux oxytropis]MCS5724163.1 ABC transporter ATP-binding protein [Herbiconiux oxytropis]MCS5725456.1 ABC transporter ATP-binding protein [Herbiconiux oxytropis]